MNRARRDEVATRLRALGHEFVAHDPSDEDLASMRDDVDGLLRVVRSSPPRERRLTRRVAESFTIAAPTAGPTELHELFADSVVSGSANPMGLGARVWREGEVAVMQVTLGAAFEGAPGRCHGGVVAALVDETMGLVMGIQGVLAFTAQLNLTFRAPTPIGEPVTARAWLDHRRARKLTVKATVSNGEILVAEATAIFVTVDPATFLEAAIEA